MNVAEKRKYLEELKEKINNFYISDSSILLLKSVLTEEYFRETDCENKSELYCRNLKQTIEKQLSLLLQNSNKREKRINLFHDAILNFNMDIDRELGNLKYQ
jgi:hypothetical protein